MEKMGTTTARPRRLHRPKPEPEEPAHAEAPSVSVQYSSGRVTGWVSHLPASWVPYVQLARLTLPAALILIYLPTLFGVLLAAILARGGGGGDRNNGINGDFHFPNPWWYTCLLLLVSSFFFSNAAHAWDDLADAPIDILIPRTARRPIPRGDVSPLAAFTFVAANAAGAGITLLGFPDPAGTLRYALPNILATAYYPYAKRHTNLPQLVLGLCLAWGVVMGAVAVGCEPFALGDLIRLHPGHTLPHVFSPHLPQEPLSQLPLPFTLPLTLPTPTPSLTLTLSLPFLTLLTASALWSAIYDTIYAAEDIDADLRLGLGSIAVLCGLRHTKTALWGLLGLLGGCLVMCGMALPPSLNLGGGGGDSGGDGGAGAGWVFYVLAPGGCTAALGAMVWSVDLRDARSTWWWFRYGYWLVGGALVGGLGSELMRRAG